MITEQFGNTKNYKSIFSYETKLMNFIRSYSSKTYLGSDKNNYDGKMEAFQKNLEVVLGKRAIEDIDKPLSPKIMGKLKKHASYRSPEREKRHATKYSKKYLDKKDMKLKPLKEVKDKNKRKSSSLSNKGSDKYNESRSSSRSLRRGGYSTRHTHRGGRRLAGSRSVSSDSRDMRKSEHMSRNNLYLKSKKHYMFKQESFNPKDKYKTKKYDGAYSKKKFDKTGSSSS